MLKQYSDADIQNALSITDVNKAIELAFLDYENQDSRMPEKVYLELPDYEGDFRAMPAYSKRYNLASLKWVNSHPNNTKYPAVMAQMIVNDPATGQAIALLDATVLTALRTGAAGAIAAKYLSKENASSVCFIGAGVQAYYQLDCLVDVRPIQTVYVHDINETQSQAFCDYASKKGLSVYGSEHLETACLSADIIVTTTGSKQPILKQAFIKEGVHINAIGADAPGKQECEAALLNDVTVIVDDLHQATHSGEINVPITTGAFVKSDIYASLGAIIKANNKGLQTKKTLFDSTGLAIQDIALAGLFLNNRCYEDT